MLIMSKLLKACPNCRGKDWSLENMQATMSVRNIGQGEVDLVGTKGNVFDVWTCDGCQYAMFFIKEK